MRPPAVQPLPALALIRRLAIRQYNLILENEAGAALGLPAALHDLRVAIRRLRTILRSFRKPLARTTAARRERALRRFSRRLGRARDLDVWIAFLESHPAWADLLAAARRERERERRRVARMMMGREYARLKAGLDRLVHGELTPERLDPELPAAGLAARALLKQLGRMDKRRAACRRPTPARIHALRIAGRRARYLAEFSATCLDFPASAIIARLRRLQDILGEIHDMDVWFTHLRSVTRAGVTHRARKLSRERERKVKRFVQTWRECRRYTARVRLQERLELLATAQP